MSFVSFSLAVILIKRLFSTSAFRVPTIFFSCIFRYETTKTRRKNAKNLKKNVDLCQKRWRHFFFISAKSTNLEVSSLGLELHVSMLGLGIFDEVSVSSRNFNQVSVSVSKVTVSTRSLTSGSREP